MFSKTFLRLSMSGNSLGVLKLRSLCTSHMICAVWFQALRSYFAQKGYTNYYLQLKGNPIHYKHPYVYRDSNTQLSFSSQCPKRTATLWTLYVYTHTKRRGGGVPKSLKHALTFLPVSNINTKFLEVR